MSSDNPNAVRKDWSSNNPLPSARTGRLSRTANFSFFELWQLRKLHIATATQSTNIDTISVWSIINGEPDCQEARELIEELQYHLAGGIPSIKVRRLWTLTIEDRPYPFYAESEEEATHHAQQLARWGGDPGTLQSAPKGHEDNPGVISIISYIAQRSTPFK